MCYLCEKSSVKHGWVCITAFKLLIKKNAITFLSISAFRWTDQLELLLLLFSITFYFPLPISQFDSNLNPHWRCLVIFSTQRKTAELAHLPLGGADLCSFYLIYCQNINMEHTGLTFAVGISAARGYLKGRGDFRSQGCLHYNGKNTKPYACQEVQLSPSLQYVAVWKWAPWIQTVWIFPK